MNTLEAVCTDVRSCWMPSRRPARMGLILKILDVHHMWPEGNKLLVHFAMLGRLPHPVDPTNLRRENLLVLFERVGLRGGDTASKATIDLAALADSLSKLLEGRDRRLPVDTGVSNRDTLLEGRRALGGNLLVTLVNVRLDHNTNDGLLALADLVSHNLGNLGLVAVVLVGIA